MEFWKTWDDREMEFDSLTHQHLSNIYYFMKYLNPRFYPSALQFFVKKYILVKFGGILQYHPDPKFVGERRVLIRLGYLKPNGDIIVDSKKIGSYV